MAEVVTPVVDQDLLLDNFRLKGVPPEPATVPKNAASFD